MELTQLESLLKVAETGSITRAAEELHLTQPAVSQHIRALEREMKVRLLDRTGRGVRLTAAGEALRDHARRSLAILEESRLVLADLEAGSTGRLVIGAGVTTSIFHLPGWLRAFRESHPGVDVVVRAGRSREIAQLALDREIDLGLVTSPVEHDDLLIRGLFEEEIALVAPSDHPLAGGEMGSDELSAAPLILFPAGTGFRSYLDRTLAEAGVRARVKMESDSVEAIKRFIEVGLGLSFLPAPAVEEEVRSGRLSRVLTPGIPPLSRTTSVIRRKDRYLSAAARGMLRVLESSVEDQKVGRLKAGYKPTSNLPTSQPSTPC